MRARWRGPPARKLMRRPNPGSPGDRERTARRTGAGLASTTLVEQRSGHLPHGVTRDPSPSSLGHERLTDGSRRSRNRRVCSQRAFRSGAASRSRLRGCGRHPSSPRSHRSDRAGRPRGTAASRRTRRRRTTPGAAGGRAADQRRAARDGIAEDEVARVISAVPSEVSLDRLAGSVVDLDDVVEAHGEIGSRAAGTRPAGRALCGSVQ